MTILLLLLLALPSALAAQTAGREPALVELPVGARSVALGHAYQVGDADPDAVFHNPALLGRSEGVMLGYTRFGDGGVGLSLSHARSWLGGRIGVGVRALEAGSPGPGARRGGVDPLLDRGSPGVGELSASLAYARTLFGVRLGVTGRLVDQRFDEARNAAASFDVGVAHELGPLSAALAVRNIGPDRDLGGDEEIPQPLLVTLGVGGYGEPVGPLDLGFAASLSVRDDGEVEGGGGLEIGYWPIQGRTFVLRIGGRHVPEGEASPLTLGASFWGDDLVLAYAFQPVDGLDDVHRITVGWR